MEPQALCGLGLQFVPLLQFTVAMNLNEAGRRCLYDLLTLKHFN